MESTATVSADDYKMLCMSTLNKKQGGNVSDLATDPRFLETMLLIAKAEPLFRTTAAELMISHGLPNYRKLSMTMSIQLRNDILTTLRTQDEAEISIILCRLSGGLARMENFNWPEVYQLVTEFGEAPDERLKSICLRMILELGVNVNDSSQLASLRDATFAILGRLLSDASSSVASVAVLVFVKLHEKWLRLNKPEPLVLEPIFSAFVGTIRRFMIAQDSKEVYTALFVFLDAIRFEGKSFFTTHAELVMTLTFEILSPEYGMDLEVLNVVAGIHKGACEEQSEILSNSGLLEKIMDQICVVFGRFDIVPGQRLNEELPSNADAYPMNAKICLCFVALCGRNMDVSLVAEVVGKFCELRITSSLLKDRYFAGRLCKYLSTMVKPFQELGDDLVNRLLSPVLKAIDNDHEDCVRESALAALAAFAGELQTSMFPHYNTVLPVLLRSLRNANVYIQGEACVAIKFCCDMLPNGAVLEHLPQLLPEISNVLKAGNTLVVSKAVSVVGAIAFAAKMDFLPYLESFMATIAPLLSTPVDLELDVVLRRQALQTFANIAFAVKEHFKPHAATGIIAAYSKGVSSNPNVMESRYIFITKCAAAIGEDLLVTFHYILPDIIGTATGANMSFTISTGDISDSDSEEDEDEGFQYNKAVALQALRALNAIAVNAPKSFAPHWLRVLDDITSSGTIRSPIPDVMIEALKLLGSLARSMRKAAGLPEGLVGDSAPGESVTDIPEEIWTRVPVLLQILFLVVETYDDEKVVMAALNALGVCFQEIGPAILPMKTRMNDPNAKTCVDRVVEVLNLYLAEKSPFQLVLKSRAKKNDGSDDSEDEDDEYDEDEWNDFLDTVISLMERVADVMRGNFIVPLKKSLFSLIMKLLKPSRKSVDRAVVVGVLAKIAEVTGSDFVQFVPQILKVLPSLLKEDFPSLRRNAAFALGAMVKHTGTALVPHFPVFLQCLHPLCIRPASNDEDGPEQADIDNALSAVCHLIRAAPTSVPLGMVVPIILAAMPLRDDTSEAVNIYKCLVELLKAFNPTVIVSLSRLLTLMGNELVSTSGDHAEEITEYITAELRTLFGTPETASHCQPALGALSDETAKNAIEAALSLTIE